MERLNDNDTENLCIDFCKYILSTKITEVNTINKEEYIPIEFSLMKGELVKNGHNIYEEFIKERYGIRNIK